MSSSQLTVDAPVPRAMQHFRLTHPDLDLCVEVRVEPFASEQWMARADLAGEQEVGVDKDRTKAIEKALRFVGWRYGREMAASADLAK